MKKGLMSVGVIILAAVASGCAGVGGYTQPAGLFPTGGVYMDTTSGGIIHDNGVTPTKTGKACGTSILGIVATGDTTVEAAMSNGGIHKAVYTEQSLKHILHLWAEVCTIVKGN
ncbi:MAG: TRL-like family protein [Nitrospira sp.]